MALAIVVVVVLIIVWAIGIYNGLVSQRNKVKNAWSQIDVQLQRRFDLIPNLVETVKGYMEHEKGVLEKVTELRTSWANATTVSEKAELDNQLSGALKTIMAVSENYPDLKANQNFSELQEELKNTENKVAYSRQFYNDTVTNFNKLRNLIQKLKYSQIIYLLICFILLLLNSSKLIKKKQKKTLKYNFNY